VEYVFAKSRIYSSEPTRSDAKPPRERPVWLRLAWLNSAFFEAYRDFEVKQRAAFHRAVQYVDYW
jgi:hypothetical protein